jgi:hypothetical protein
MTESRTPPHPDAVHKSDLSPQTMFDLAPPSLYARTLAHSRSCYGGTELFTHEIRFPRIILAEWNTHKMIYKNGSSVRAIPLATQINNLRADPYVPWYFGLNRSGMASDWYFIPGSDMYEVKKAEHLEDMQTVIGLVERRANGEWPIHKQQMGRMLESFMWQTMITTATDWQNFFRLRIAADAQPDIQALAVAIRTAQRASTAVDLEPGQWHIPLADLPGDENLTLHQRIAVSVGRCARSSYGITFRRGEVDKDMDRGRALWLPGHASPFEHQATPAEGRRYALDGFANTRWVLDTRADEELTRFVA